MKQNIFKLYLLGFFILSDFAVFAQPAPGDDTPAGDLDSPDAPAAPINGKIIWLAILGLVYALHMYRTRTKKA